MLLGLSKFEHLAVSVIALLIFIYIVVKISEENSSRYEFEHFLILLGTIIASGVIAASFLFSYPLRSLFESPFTPDAITVVTVWLACFGLCFVVLGTAEIIFTKMTGKSLI